MSRILSLPSLRRAAIPALAWGWALSLAMGGPSSGGSSVPWWDLAARTGEVKLEVPGGEPRLVRVVGRVDFLADDAGRRAEIEAQVAPTYRTAAGETVQADRRELVDPIDGLGLEAVGGPASVVDPPFDHTADGSPLGLKVADERNERAAFYNRIGVRLPGTPAGRLLFAWEMSGPNGEDPVWFFREIEAPLPGCPWRPTRVSVQGENRKTHLRKLAVFQVEPWKNPAERIPAKLRREDLSIDFDAAKLTWTELKDWMAAQISDATVPADRPFVIQLPAGEIRDDARPFVVASRYEKWGAAIYQLTGGRKVWLVGHPDTVIPNLQITRMANLGVLFCRFNRLTPDRLSAAGEKMPEAVVGLDGDNLDFRNNWLECPDGVAFAGIQLRSITNTTILDSILATSGAGISTPGGARVTSSVIARNWIERGHDAIQMYGSWVDTIVAYNHFAGASGSANREGGSPNLGANLHADEFQSQANQTDRFPQSFYVFCNFAQFGRHNWPPADAELGGGTQNVIIDGDAYARTHFYWNVFQNLAPGYRGFLTINPDKDWALEDAKRSARDFIENLTIMGNAFLDRLDFNNRPPLGYVRGLSSIAGRYGQPLFELVNAENVYARTGHIEFPALFKGAIDGRPDPVLRTGPTAGTPAPGDVYERPITYSGSHDTRYEADFSRTSHAGDKLLEGFVAPRDYAPKPGWEASPGGAARLVPAAELEKIAPMPTDLAKFLGDASRPGGFFDEFRGPATPARRESVPAPWRQEARNDGFLLHVKFGSAGTPGRRRELLRESDTKGLTYAVALTERNTAEFVLERDGKVLSRVESTDTFSDGDHLTVQVYTPYFPLVSESHFPHALMARLYGEGVRTMRYVSSDTPPEAPPDTADTVTVWLDPSRNHRFFQRREGAWEVVNSGLDAVHAAALRGFHAAERKAGGTTDSPVRGTVENFQRDAFPLPSGRVFTLRLDGAMGGNPGDARAGDLSWVRDRTGVPGLRMLLDGKWMPAEINAAPVATGRPRCFIRHNIDHQHKRLDWVWTPDVNLPRGEVTLFDGFDGSYETFRVIRGGQGQYGEPSFRPTYRLLESVASVLSFVRAPLDADGRVPGWGTPEIVRPARAAR